MFTENSSQCKETKSRNKMFQYWIGRNKAFPLRCHVCRKSEGIFKLLKLKNEFIIVNIRLYFYIPVTKSEIKTKLLFHNRPLVEQI